MDFLEVDGWKRNGMIVHGFGTRGKFGGRVTRQDWWEQSIKDREEVFPLVSIQQVQGDGVVVFEGNPQKPEEFWLKEGDALVTHIQGYALGVFTADCLPLLLFDPIQRVVGIVHAGWRGTAKEISQKTVEKMKEAFNCASENILAAMGPCIGACCLEVDKPVKEAFAKSALPWELVASPRGIGKWSLDLHRANMYFLEHAGLRKENIHRLKFCTSCRRDIFYSYRAWGEIQGRQLSFIALRKDGFKGVYPENSPEGQREV
jgi:YfiH family protein